MFNLNNHIANHGFDFHIDAEHPSGFPGRCKYSTHGLNGKY
jgi:hypothetical protein